MKPGEIWTVAGGEDHAGKPRPDKISTVSKTKVSARVSWLDNDEMLRLNRAVLVFLGLAVSLRTRREA